MGGGGGVGWGVSGFGGSWSDFFLPINLNLKLLFFFFCAGEGGEAGVRLE